MLNWFFLLECAEQEDMVVRPVHQIEPVHMLPKDSKLEHKKKQRKKVSDSFLIVYIVENLVEYHTTVIFASC